MAIFDEDKSKSWDEKLFCTTKRSTARLSMAN